MNELLETWLLSYPALAAACTLAGLGMPVPEDVVILYAGLSIASGRFAWGPVIAIVLIGFLIRDTLAWSLGYALGDKLLEAAWFQRLISPAKVQHARHLIRERGALAVFGGRFMVGMRAPMFIVAGASGIPYTRFITWDLLGMTITMPLLLGTGYWMGPPVLESAQAALPWLSNFVLVAVLAYGLWWFRRQQTAE